MTDWLHRVGRWKANRIGFTARGCDVTTIESSQYNSNKKYLVTGAAVIAIAIAAYGLGRVYPPLGPTEGTIAPAERYVSSQVGEGDVTLGDTSVAKLMQTDAFEVISKNPSFQALASDPNFAALAQNGPAMAAVAANPAAFTALARDPAAFQAAANAAAATESFVRRFPVASTVTARITPAIKHSGHS